MGNIQTITDLIDGTRTQSFQYDGLNRIAQAQSTAYGTLTYNFDAIGNMTYNSQVGGYSYLPAKPHAVITAGANSYTYDPNGNMMGRNGATLTHDYENRLVSLVAGGTTTIFVYDAAGGRVKKTSSSITTLYIGKLYECTSGVCTSHIFAGGNRIVSKKPSGTYYYHTDHLGSSSVITNASGAKEQEIYYYPFGQTRFNSGSVDLHHKYTGQEEDAETGLYFYGARYYDPAIGRFISADTIVSDPSNPQSLNRYTYVLNNPLRYTDPTGHAEITFTCDISAGCPVSGGNGGGQGSGGGEGGSYEIDIDRIGNWFEDAGHDIGEIFNDTWDDVKDWFGFGGGSNCNNCPSFRDAIDGILLSRQSSGVTSIGPVYGGGLSSGQGGGYSLTFVTMQGAYDGASALNSGYPPSSANNAMPPRSASSSSGGVSQYITGVASTALMFGQFLTGYGPSDLTFGPGSVESQMMASSPGITQAINDYSNGKPTGLYTFGFSGLVAAGANPIQQFVGSYTYTVTPGNGGLNVTLSNYTNVWSFSYHHLPSHSRSTFRPMGTTHQTYQVFMP
jgi:RHS repeat-associated protein